MKGFVQGVDRRQATLLPECLDDWVDESNPVRAVRDVFVDAVGTARPGVRWRPPGGDRLWARGIILLGDAQAVHLRLSQPGPIESRRLEREACRNLEVMWLTGRLPRAGITKPSPTSARTMVPRSRRFARASSSCAARWACWRRPRRCHRRQQVQGREQSRQQLHAGQDPGAGGSRSKRAWRAT